VIASESWAGVQRAAADAACGGHWQLVAFTAGQTAGPNDGRLYTFGPESGRGEIPPAGSPCQTPGSAWDRRHPGRMFGPRLRDSPHRRAGLLRHLSIMVNSDRMENSART